MNLIPTSINSTEGFKSFRSSTSMILDHRINCYTSSKKDGEVRQYTKPGGIEQLEKDFEKAPGVQIEVDGLDIKSLSDGTKIIKRPTGSDSGPTLEVQPPKSNPKYPDSKIRVKVRYL